MKRVLFILTSVVCIALIYVAFNAELFGPSIRTERKSCTGYEVIEAGKGINCYGDTIKLTKRSGFYEVSANYTQP
jgi:hypothetical protein